MLESLFLVACYAVVTAIIGMIVFARLPIRFGYLAGALVCAGLLGTGLFFQHVMKLDPCPLCIFQRVVFLTLMVIFLVAAAHGPGRVAAYVYAALLAVVAAVGAGIAGRQMWLQHLPADLIPECGPGLDFMLRKYSIAAVLEKVLKGSGECADPAWIFMGLSIAGWALVWFVLFAVLGVFLCVLVQKRAR